MSVGYEYENEEAIHSELICNICQEPYNDPCCAPCGEIYCRECISRWIQAQNGSCPHCRKTILIKDLHKVPRSLQNMLDRLVIKCTACGQGGMKRSDFDHHIQEVCPKAVISCPSLNNKCSWKGQRDQIRPHLIDCPFLPMKSIITSLIVENQQLKEQVHLLTNQTAHQRDDNQKLKNLVEKQTILLSKGKLELEQLATGLIAYENENQKLNKQIIQSRAQVNTIQPNHQQFDQSVGKKNTALTSMNSESGELNCGGHACPKCLKCCDWYDPGFLSSYMKRNGATCRRDVIGFSYFFTDIYDTAGVFSVIYHLCRCGDQDNK